VFAAGFALDAAEAVGDGDVVDVLARLVATSVVQAESQSDGSMRYRLLEPLRQFAREQLVDRGDLEQALRRQMAYVLALAERATREQFGPNQLAWFRRMAAEWENVRAALEWTVETGDTVGALRLAAAALGPQRHTLAEGRARLRQVLALPGAEAHELLRGRVQGALALASLMVGDVDAAAGLVEEALAIGRRQGDAALEVRALSVQGGVHLFRGQLDRAEETFIETMALCRRAGLRIDEARVLERLADVALARGDLLAAEVHIREALHVGREAGDAWSLAMGLNALGDVLRSRGDHEGAGSAYEEAMPLFTALDPRGEPPPGTVHNLGYVALGGGDPRQAARCSCKVPSSTDAWGQTGVAWPSASWASPPPIWAQVMPN
jgi:tetratricopeptide (TPR) repeat protein